MYTKSQIEAFKHILRSHGMVIIKLNEAEMLMMNIVDQLRKTTGGINANRLASSNNALGMAIIETKEVFNV